MASLPAHLIVVRVQAPGYKSQTIRNTYGTGRFSVVTIRDVEKDEDFKRIARLGQVAQVGTLSRILLPRNLETLYQLRRSAAQLHADMLLVYTFDTDFYTGDSSTPISVITAGLSPHVEAEVHTTASAVLFDVRTGYVYGTLEQSDQNKKTVNHWDIQYAVDRLRLKTERRAFEKLLDEFGPFWTNVVVERIRSQARADR